MTENTTPQRTRRGFLAGLAITGALAVTGTGVALATAADPTPSASPSSQSSKSTTNDCPAGAQGGDEGRGPRDGHGPHDGHGPRGTAVTGDEAAKVTAAVKAKDSSFTADHVMKDDDGSYHVMGKKNSQRAGYEVSKDLKTITEHTPGKDMGPGKGGHKHTAATATQTKQVTAAVKAKDSAVTITTIEVDPDGSFDARGTKAGSKVFFEVSKDLKTVEQR